MMKDCLWCGASVEYGSVCSYCGTAHGHSCPAPTTNDVNVEGLDAMSGLIALSIALSPVLVGIVIAWLT